jgi:uncharacterized membrane-anchored protein YitT (DUF2179 family)
MTLGIAITAFSLDAFLIPNKLAAGGVSGLATVIYYWMLDNMAFAVPIGTQMLIMNAALLLVAFKVRGVRYIAKTLFGAVLLSVLVDVMAPFIPHLGTSDLLLAALYGGVVSGVGMGLVFKAGGNTGGTDIVGQLLSSRLPFGVGQIMLVVDASITLLAAVQFGPTLALYGAVAIFVCTMTIDIVLEGLPIEKAVYVISDAAPAIAQSVTAELGRGATFLDATGAWTGEPRGMLLVVLSRNELDDLKAIVRSHDGDAMVIISNVNETIGEGFRSFG